MNTKKLTTIIILITLTGLIIYDIVIAVSGGVTISEVVWSVLDKPFIPFLAGFLCGHLFWQK